MNADEINEWVDEVILLLSESPDKDSVKAVLQDAYAYAWDHGRYSE